MFEVDGALPQSRSAMMEMMQEDETSKIRTLKFSQACMCGNFKVW